MKVSQVMIDNSKRSGTDIIPRLAGSERCDPGHSFGPSIRDYYLLHYCVSGKGVYIREEGEYEISEGEIFIIRPGEVTTYIADKSNPWHYVWIGFDGNDAEKLSGIQPVVKYVSDTFMRIAECTKLGILSPEIYISQIYEIIYNLFSGTPRNVDFCKQVKDYIRFNYMNEITVELIAESMGLSRRYLSRIFKEKYGKPIKSYLISVRCEKAAEFLSIGYTVTEAAVMSGYSDIFAFSKIFHKVMKMSPSEYRKRTYGFQKDV